jgi:Ala-tRNA(Pro) deacylase
MKAHVNIRQILENENVSYRVLEHPLAFTALEIAESQHIPGQEVVKTIIVKGDTQIVMCVLPATHKIDFTKLLKVLNATEGHLVPEGLLAQLFPEYEVGAMPPFGHLAGLKVYVDKILEENEHIAFNAGSHREMLQIKFKDFVRLTSPSIVDIGVHI